MKKRANPLQQGLAQDRWPHSPQSVACFVPGNGKAGKLTCPGEDMTVSGNWEGEVAAEAGSER